MTGFLARLGRRLRGADSCTCAVVTPIGPGHEDAYAECRASVRAAWRAGRGPFARLHAIAVEDCAGRLGRSRARNEGVRRAAAAGADWIFFLDADDLLFEEAFERVRDLVPRYDAVWGLITTQRADEGEPRLRFPQPVRIESLEELVLFDPVVTLQMGHFVRTAVALENPFDETLDAGEDFDYYLRLWRRYRCVKVPRAFFLNRRGRPSGGPRGATAQQWLEATRARVAAERARLGLEAGAPRTIEIENRCAAALHAFAREGGLADSSNYLALSRQVPYRGLHRIAGYAGEPFAMYSDNDDLVCARLAWTGEYEYLSSRLWQTLARRARVIADVGAYTGFYALLAARANPQARIFCFEPLARNYERLVHNLRLNGCERVQAVRAAASRSDGQGEIDVCGDADFLAHGASLAAPREPLRRERVELVRLDTFLERCGACALELAKVDAEGHEFAVLEGLRETIRAARPDLVLEVTNAEEAAAATDLLRSHGYAFYAIRDSSGALEPRPGLVPAGTEDRNALATVRAESEVKALLEEALHEAA